MLPGHGRRELRAHQAGRAAWVKQNLFHVHAYTTAHTDSTAHGGGGAAGLLLILLPARGTLPWPYSKRSSNRLHLIMDLYAGCVGLLQTSRRCCLEDLRHPYAGGGAPEGGAPPHVALAPVLQQCIRTVSQQP